MQFSARVRSHGHRRAGLPCFFTRWAEAVLVQFSSKNVESRESATGRIAVGILERSDCWAIRESTLPLLGHRSRGHREMTNSRAERAESKGKFAPTFLSSGPHAQPGSQLCVRSARTRLRFRRKARAALKRSTIWSDPGNLCDPSNG